MSVNHSLKTLYLSFIRFNAKRIWWGSEWNSTGHSTAWFSARVTTPMLTVYMCLAGWDKLRYIEYTRQVSSMIHLARSKVWPVMNIVLLHLEKWRWTYGQTTHAKAMITTGRDCGSTMWINCKYFTEIDGSLANLVTQTRHQTPMTRVFVLEL